MNITMQALSKLFPKDTLWTTSGLEIIGYSFKENRHIVIEDGLCYMDDGKFMVHEYSPKNPDYHQANWNRGEWPAKYLLPEQKIREEWVNFDVI